MILRALVRNIQCALLIFGLGGMISAHAATASQANVPLFFEPNQGQAPAEARYLLRDGTADALFLQDRISLILPQSQDSAFNLGIEFVGASTNAKIEGLGRLAGKSNYLIGKDSSRWLRGLPNFARVKYHEIYPGIDLLFYGNEHSLEHDFEVEPGADVRRIAFKFDGATSLDISATGDLLVHIPNGVLTLQRPHAYQDSITGRTDVAAGFALAPDGTVSFKLGSFDASRKLVIDPVLVSNTYLSTFGTVPTAVATDAAGDTFVTGYTIAPSYPAYPVTPGAFRTTCADCANQAVFFVTKLNPMGTAQIYSTFLGAGYGNLTPEIEQTYPRIAVDGSGDAIVVGVTAMTDFPIKNPAVPTPVASAGDLLYCGFILSLTPDGSDLNYSTALGGSALAVTVDGQGNAYFTGSTSSASSFPVTPGALNVSPDPEDINDYEVFISKLTPAGSLVYSALLGFDASPNWIALDSQDNAYITGVAGSNWSSTPGAYNIPGGSVFVTKLSADGSKLDYSAILGKGYGMGIAVDANNDAYVAGIASDNTFPVTSNAYIVNPYQCCSQHYAYSFFSQISSDGSTLLYSSFYPGQTTAMTLDNSANIWLAGYPYYETIPLQYPLDSIDSNNTFLSEFDPTGTKLEFSTFLYGTLGSNLVIAADPSGKVHVAGSTSGAASPTWNGMYATPGAFIGSVSGSVAYNLYGYPLGYAAVIDPAPAASAVCFGNYFPPAWSVDTGIGTPQTYPITNCGNAPLTISSIVPTDPSFTIPADANQCAGSIASGSSCTVGVQWQELKTQSCSAAVTITSNASIPTSTISLYGYDPVYSWEDCGMPGGTSVSTGQLSFGAQLVGTSSAAQTVTVVNPSVYVDQITLSVTDANGNATQDFSETDNCNLAKYNVLFALSSCVVSVSFSPTATGIRTGILSVNQLYHGAGLPTQVSLTGTGTVPSPIVTLSQSSLSFTAEAIGTTSPAQTITLTNSGQASLAVTSIAATGDFAQSNNCGTTVAAGANCTIAVTFNPTVDGTRTGTLSITDSATGSPQSVSLTGAGPTIAVSFTSTSLSIASPGESSTATVQLTPSVGPAGVFNLQCSVAYLGQATLTDLPTCTLNPAQLTIANGSTVTSTVTISTTAATSSAQPFNLWKHSSASLALLFFLGFIPFRRRKGVIGLVVLGILTATVVLGCGGGNGGGGGGNTQPQNPGTTLGNYSVTVTAVGTITASATIPLTVQ